ncbi:MAG TPA: glycoside hydrolase family 2 protein, partial [Bacteroidota bacterium]|nr:glycoside hydrolase family 2 protein [Bacteroidota bacterium]
VRLLQEKDASGRSFVVEVNGRKMFAKGADWIPSDSFIPRTPLATYNRLLRMAKDAHMNMIRVWGGGFYENDTFYDLCDRFGLMVWQDFMFACGEYPETRSFLKDVEGEAVKAVRRLRNHPSIVVWCGNNECEWLYCTENPGKTPEDMSGARIFRDLLKDVVRREDGTRPYWRSSPFGQGPPNSESNGNHHQWGVWSFWKDYPEYEKDNARFVTEFGFQGPASLKTIREVTVESDRRVQSAVLEHHNKQVEGPERLLRFLVAHYRLPATLEDFVYTGQLLQGEALKCAVEHWRRRKYKTAGALFWQLNDCWPVISWSVIDSKLRPKAAYYYSRRFYAPLLVSFRKSESGLELWLTSDLTSALHGTMEVSALSFSGRRLWRRKKAVVHPADGSACVLMLPADPALDPARSYLFARFTSREGPAAKNRFYFSEPKHLALPDPSLSWSVAHSPAHGIRVTVRARRLARCVWLDVEGGDAFFDDNAFDLDPGTEKTVLCLTDLPPHLLKRNLRVRSLR